MSATRRFVDYRAAVLIVVANMIGTGVFATLGLQAEAIKNGAALLLIWGLGGVTSLCGALCYGELAAAIPRSGGEYHFLSRIFHPLLGQLAGWASVTIGFAAPIALATMALGHYAGTVIPVDPLWIAMVTLIFVTSIHGFDLAFGRAFQVAATIVKIVVVVLFCVAALMVEPVPGSLVLMPNAGTLDAVFSAPFGLSLIYVSYAYSGWNAAAYIVDEVRQPQYTVPRALAHGTLLVTVLYVLLNLSFLRTVGAGELAGTVEVGALSARNVFGEQGGAILSLVVSLLLVSTISAMVLAGPRVLAVIGEDLPALHFLATRNRRGAPTRAVALQQALALIFIATDSFEEVLVFAGFTLTLFALLTVIALVRLRVREPELDRPFRVPLYPLPPLIFLAVSGASLLVVAMDRPVTLMAVLGLLAVGWLFFRRRKPA
jgi:APA family basic amino acid/polyamine antiporter